MSYLHYHFRDRVGAVQWLSFLWRDSVIYLIMKLSLNINKHFPASSCSD